MWRLSPVEERGLAYVGAADEDDGGEKRRVHLGEVDAGLLHWAPPWLALGLRRGLRYLCNGGVRESGGEWKAREER